MRVSRTIFYKKGVKIGLKFNVWASMTRGKGHSLRLVLYKSFTYIHTYLLTYLQNFATWHITSQS